MVPVSGTPCNLIYLPFSLSKNALSLGAKMMTRLRKGKKGFYCNPESADC
jgi:hypothetical protein